MAILALIPQVVKLGRWLWKRRYERFIPRTQGKKDRHNYDLLLLKYESYLDLLSDLIVIRSQIEATVADLTAPGTATFVGAGP